MTELKFYKKGDENRSYIPFGSARECSQTLELVSLNPHGLRRTIEGTLVEIEKPVLKYRSVIRCEDENCVSLEGVAQYSILIVECIQRLVTPFIEKNEPIKLERTPVKGSLFLHKPDGEIVLYKQEGQEEGEVIEFRSSEEGFLSYRPLLQMCLFDFQLKTDEWGCTVGWKMELEEV